ncbi:MAG: HAD family hydrolase [Kiritimatiellae bacterium]|nr:HAD family hydrolase [Kiritimatiellia bacterium]
MPQKDDYTVDDLINLPKTQDTLVCIDSDGCIFDTMEIKQKQCFHGLIISHWGLESIEKYLREAAEFVNLYSTWRGQNRFIALLKTFDLLRERKEVIDSGVAIPELPELKRFIDSGAALGNPSLQKEVDETGNKELASLLKWSLDVNDKIEATVKNIPPFKWVSESLEKIKQNSDLICVSQTPVEALVREWRENDIEKYVAVIAGQELGTKTEHIAMASKDRFTGDKILMLGDAPGDKKAAKANNALFYPINPAQEEKSWERFCKEAYDKFLNGEYTEAYEGKLIAEFEALLPETPSW